MTRTCIVSTLIFSSPLYPLKNYCCVPFLCEWQYHLPNPEMRWKEQFECRAPVLTIVVYCLFIWFYPWALPPRPAVSLFRPSWLGLLNVSWVGPLLSCSVPQPLYGHPHVCPGHVDVHSGRLASHSLLSYALPDACLTISVLWLKLFSGLPFLTEVLPDQAPAFQSCMPFPLLLTFHRALFSTQECAFPLQCPSVWLIPACFSGLHVSTISSRNFSPTSLDTPALWFWGSLYISLVIEFSPLNYIHFKLKFLISA